jgi:hypothetical protein
MELFKDEIRSLTFQRFSGAQSESALKKPENIDILPTTDFDRAESSQEISLAQPKIMQQKQQPIQAIFEPIDSHRTEK